MQASNTILAVAGSLRNGSVNVTVLRAAMALAPPGMSIDLYNDMAVLPHFNPDIEASGQLPEAVTTLRVGVAAADGLIFAIPEYAHGMPGAFKNALDWLVGLESFSSKPVLILNAQPRAGHAQSQLREVLLTMDARLVYPQALALQLASRDITVSEICRDPVLALRIADGLHDLAALIASSRKTDL